ncbi:hypothetical protein MBLNU459_g2918t1 [Dothideomycetes sp. NU459]
MASKDEKLAVSFDLVPPEMDDFAALQQYDIETHNGTPPAYMDIDIDPQLLGSAIPSPTGEPFAPSSPCGVYLEDQGALDQVQGSSTNSNGHLHQSMFSDPFPQQHQDYDHDSAMQSITSHPLNHHFISTTSFSPPQSPYNPQVHPRFDHPSFSPLRHQLVGHRRSVSVPPEDLFAEHHAAHQQYQQQPQQQHQQQQPAVTFTRGGHYLGDSTANRQQQQQQKTPSSSSKRLLKSVQKRNFAAAQRHTPYPVPHYTSSNAQQSQRAEEARPGRPRGQTMTATTTPTSAPSPTAAAALCQQSIYSPNSISNNISYSNSDVWSVQQQQQQQHQCRRRDIADLDVEALLASSGGGRGKRGHGTSATTAAALGMWCYAERLSRECEALKEFLRRGFKEVLGGGGGVGAEGAGEGKDDDNDDDELERTEKRALNRTLYSLSEALNSLPMGPGALASASVAEAGAGEISVPGTGQEIRDLGSEEVDELLDAYAIPCPSGMFLHEKKLMFLRFVGASKALMHAVLD